MKQLSRIIGIVCALITLPLMAKTVSDKNFDEQPPLKPWFTGPLLAPSGETYPKGAVGLEAYLFYTDTYGHFNRRGQRTHDVAVYSWNPTAVLFMGLTSSSDLQFNVPYYVNERSGQSSRGFGDVSVILGWQAFRDIPNTWKPALKLSLGETFPTGRHENLNPVLSGTDALGAGAFQTSLGGTFQKLVYFGNQHYLRTRWNLTYTFPSDTRIRGLSAYGGAVNTNGTVDLGEHISTDLGFEYTLTRHWVPALDVLYTNSSSSTFRGITGTTTNGLPAMISLDSRYELSLAPALEYNFNSDVGVIAGVWFSVIGREAAEFTSGVLAICVSL